MRSLNESHVSLFFEQSDGRIMRAADPEMF